MPPPRTHAPQVSQMCALPESLGAFQRHRARAFPSEEKNPLYVTFLLLCNKYHIHNGLKQHPLMISLFCKSEVQVGPPRVLCLGSHKAKIKMLARLALIWRLWEESASRLTQAIIGRIYFLVAARLRSLFPCWLSAGRWGGECLS